MPTSVPLFARRLTAGVALVALPLTAVVGCGAAAGEKKQSVQTSLQKASDNLRNSSAASVTLRFDDDKGSLKKALTTGGSSAKPEQADLLLGGSIAITYDAPAGKTLGDVQEAVGGASTSEQLKSVNVAVTVQADGGSVASIRLVNGDLYANVGVDKLAEVVRKSGSSTDVGAELDSAADQAPDQLKPVVTDVRAGKWLKLPLAPYSEQLNALQKQTAPSASVDTQKLGMDLLNAVKPFVAVTDASSSGSTRVLDVKVQAKQALKAATDALKNMQPALPGLSGLDTASLDRIGDGTANGQVTLDDDHLTKVTLDLQSAVALVPPGSTPAPDLTGSLVTMQIDDSADEVQVPDDVSSADVGALVQGALTGLTGLGSGTSS